MKNWKNKYPLNTFNKETRKELEEFIENIIDDIRNKEEPTQEDIDYAEKCEHEKFINLQNSLI